MNDEFGPRVDSGDESESLASSAGHAQHPGPPGDDDICLIHGSQLICVACGEKISHHLFRCLACLPENFILCSSCINQVKETHEAEPGHRLYTYALQEVSSDSGVSSLERNLGDDWVRNAVRMLRVDEVATTGGDESPTSLPGDDDHDMSTLQTESFDVPPSNSPATAVTFHPQPHPPGRRRSSASASPNSNSNPKGYSSPDEMVSPKASLGALWRLRRLVGTSASNVSSFVRSPSTGSQQSRSGNSRSGSAQASTPPATNVGVLSEPLDLQKKVSFGETVYTRSTRSSSLASVLSCAMPLSPRSNASSSVSLCVPVHQLSQHERTVFGMEGRLPKSKLAALKNLPRQRLMTEQEAFAVVTVPDLIKECIDRQSSQLMLCTRDPKLTEVPQELFKDGITYPWVTTLDLSLNALTSLPDCLMTAFPNLTHLNVSENRLTSIPESLWTLPLETLELNHNCLSSLPDSIGAMDTLQLLALDFNDFAEFPSIVLQSPSLTTVYLAANYRLCALPPKETLRQVDHKLSIGLDNHPAMYDRALEWKLGMSEEDDSISNIEILWNKIFPDCVEDDRLYIGSLKAVQTPHVFEYLKIGSVLSVGRNLDVNIPPGTRHKVITVDDLPGASFEAQFIEAFDFIDASVKECPDRPAVLIHCFAGMSRSSTCAIAYLMERRNMRLDEAYLEVKDARPCIYPNDGFFKQLIDLDARLYPKPSRPLELGPLNRKVGGCRNVG